MASCMVRECGILLKEIGGRGNGRTESSMATAPSILPMEIGWRRSGGTETVMATALSTVPMEVGGRRSGGTETSMATAPSSLPTVSFQVEYCSLVTGLGAFGVRSVAFHFVHAVLAAFGVVWIVDVV